MRRSSLATALLWLVQTDASCLTSVACNGAGQTWQQAGITYSCCTSNTAANSEKCCSSASDCTAATAIPPPPSPPPPSPPASQASAYFTVDDPCTTDGACVRSPNYPSDYGINEACTITPTSLTFGQLLSASAGFDTESGYHKLTVNGEACNRPQHFLLALRHIEAQDYRPLEALVVDDGTAQLKRLLRNAYPAVEILSTPLLPSDATNASARLMVRLLSLPYRASIGEKRALAVQSACGKGILHWGDDNFHQERRVSAQALPIIRGEADLSALELTNMVTMPNRHFYTVRGVRGSLFASLAYSASLGRVLFFGNVSLGEDLDFAERAVVQARCCSSKRPLPPRLCHS